MIWVLAADDSRGNFQGGGVAPYPCWYTFVFFCKICTIRAYKSFGVEWILLEELTKEEIMTKRLHHNILDCGRILLPSSNSGAMWSEWWNSHQWRSFANSRKMYKRSPAAAAQKTNTFVIQLLIINIIKIPIHGGRTRRIAVQSGIGILYGLGTNWFHYVHREMN